LGLSVSEGALMNMFIRSHPAFEVEADKALAILRQAQVVASDETGVRIEGTNSYHWVFHCKDAVVHQPDYTREGRVVVEVMGGHVPDVWLSDRYGGQQNRGARQQTCLAHLDRDAEFAFEHGGDDLPMRFKLWFDKAFELARDLGVLAASTCSAKKRKLEKQLADMLTTPTDCDLAAKLQAKIGRARAQLLSFCDYPGQVEPSRVDDWRGGGESRGVAVFRRLSPIAGASVRSFAPFPVAARQTVQAGFPHTAFTPSIRPSLSAG
jgi:transposase